MKRVLSLILAMILTMLCCVALGATENRTDRTEAVQNATPKSIQIEGSHDVAKGKTIKLRATVKPTSASQKLIWKSSNKKIVKVTDEGKVTGVKAGTAVITATSVKNTKIKKTWKITVKPKAVTGIKITAESKTIYLSDSKKLTLKAKASPSKASQSFEWESSNPKVAKVSKSGVVTGLKAGKTTITAFATDGSRAKQTIKITVKKGSAGPTAEPTDKPTEKPTEAPTEEPSSQPKYRALLIGEKSFLRQNEFYQLYLETANRNQGDVNNMKAMLSRVTGPTGGTYSVTTKIDATWAGIRNAIQSTFAGTTDDDVSLFFIASHGNSNGDGELEIAYSGRLDNQDDLEEYLQHSVLSFDTLASWLKTYVKGKVIVVLESCGAGSAIYDPDEENGTRGIASYVELKGRRGDSRAESIALNAVRAFAKADPGITESNSTGDLRLSKFYVLYCDKTPM